MAKLSAIDLFCGCGGLTVGLKQAGFRVIGALDLDPLAVESYKLNHRKTKIWEDDIRKVAAVDVLDDLKMKAGDLDLLAGCPPCQGFSSLRTLNGSRGVRDRSKDLVFQFLRFVRVLKPRAVMMENVPGLAHDRRMRELSRALRSLGYTVQHRILDAADFGVPQRRRRLILLAGRAGEIPFAKPLPDRVTVRHAIKGLPRPGKTGDPLHDLGEKRKAEVEELISQIPKNGGSRSDLAVFIDGDFWHGYRFPAWEHQLPEFWRHKIGRNRERDSRNFRKLRRQGWRVMRIWQHQIERDLPGCLRKVLEAARLR